MKRLAAFVLLLAGIGSAYAGDGDAERLRAWRAGEKVTEEAVAEYGIDRCFASSEIGDALLARMYGKSYKPDCTGPASELRYLRGLHRNLAGETLLGELVCNEAISGDLLEIFRALYDAAYPIERMVLIDEYDAQDGPSIRANNSSAFNFRFIAGTGVLSNHSRGMAVDINPLYTPLCQNERRPHGRRPRGSCPLCRTEAGFPLQDRRGRPLLPGVPAPQIHLGRPLEKPEGLPAFREKAIAARKPQHCAGEAARGYFGTATIDSESLPGIPGQHPASSGQHKGSPTFRGREPFSFGHPRIFRRPDYFTPKSFPFSEKLSYSALSEAIRSRTDWIFSARHALAPQKA